MKIFTAHNPTEAHIVCELLKSQQISCEVRGEGIFGLQGEIPFGEQTEPYVWLLDVAQAETARAIVSDYQQPDTGRVWRCHKCGESNEPQFALCWNCGSGSP